MNARITVEEIRRRLKIGRVAVERVKEKLATELGQFGSRWAGQCRMRSATNKFCEKRNIGVYKSL